MSKSELTRDELAAALAVRHELGREYEPEVLDGIADRIERVIETRVVAKLSEQNARQSGTMKVAIGSIIASLPLTGIAGDQAGFAGMALAWAGLAAINLAHAFASRGPRR
jgi:uncharacterized membrane protein